MGLFGNNDTDGVVDSLRDSLKRLINRQVSESGAKEVCFSISIDVSDLLYRIGVYAYDLIYVQSVAEMIVGKLNAPYVKDISIDNSSKKDVVELRIKVRSGYIHDTHYTLDDLTDIKQVEFEPETACINGKHIATIHRLINESDEVRLSDDDIGGILIELGSPAKYTSYTTHDFAVLIYSHDRFEPTGDGTDTHLRVDGKILPLCEIDISIRHGVLHLCSKTCVRKSL